MKKLILIALLALPLGGCSVESIAMGVGAVANVASSFSTVVIKNPISKNRLAQMIAGYGVLQSAANVYRDLCNQKAIDRSCRAVVEKLQAADLKAIKAINTAAKFIGENPTVDASSLVDLAFDAFTIFKNIAVANKVVANG